MIRPFALFSAPRVSAFASSIVALTVYSQALGQEQTAAGEVPEAEATLSGVVGATVEARSHVEVRVTTTDANFSQVPVVGERVKLHLVRGPRDLVDTLEQSTDSEGVARFEFAQTPGVSVVAEHEGARRSFTDNTPVGEQPVELELSVLGTTEDPSEVFASRVVTMMQPNENFLTVQQIWTLAVERPVVFEPRTDAQSTWIRIPVPEEAVGIEVMRPGPQFAQVSDNVVLFAGSVEPAGGGTQQGPQLMLRYSLKHDNQSDYLFDQELGLDVESASFVVGLETSFEDFPLLDVSLDVPLCDAPEAGLMCFGQVTRDADDLSVRLGGQVVAARMGRADAGERMQVASSGWPSQSPWRLWLASFAALMGIFMGGWLVSRELRGMRGLSGRREAERAWQERRGELLAMAADLEQRFGRGELLESDYDLGLERIREELGALNRRQREWSESEPK